MRWQFSARLTSLIVLAVISLAVGGSALGLALARGASGGDSREVASHMERAKIESAAKVASPQFKRTEGKDSADRSRHGENTRDAERFKRGADGRGWYHDWWGPRRVVVIPRIRELPRSFFHGDSPHLRGVERTQPRQQVARPGGMVIAVGEVTAVRDGAIEMFTVLGNEVTIDIGQLSQETRPEVGAPAIVIAERAGDGYVAQSMDLLDVRLSEMLEGMRARSRSGS